MTDSVRAKLGYAAAMATAPVQHSSDPVGNNLDQDWRDVEIRDARKIAGRGASLAEHGFQTIPISTGLTEVEPEGDWRGAFAEAAIAAVKEATGATQVFLPPAFANVRKASVSGSYGPATFCHSDFTPGSAARKLAALDPVLAADRLGKRFAAYNLWWLVSPPPQDKPLALCDASSVAAADFIPAEARFHDLSGAELSWGEIAVFRYNPRHRWYYYPEMSRDELLIWAGYDSDPAFASMVPHTAFDNDRCPVGAPPRVNVDCRCLAIWE